MHVFNHSGTQYIGAQTNNIIKLQDFLMGQAFIKCINCNNDKFKGYIKTKGNRGVDFISYQHNVVVCEHCGLVFINPQHDDQDYEKFYKALNYKKMVSPKEKAPLSKREILDYYKFKKIPLKFLVDYLKSNRAIGDQARVLDVGCGFGVFTLLMQESGLQVEGLEQSEDTVDFAKKQFGLKVHAGSIFDHSLPENHYDIVTNIAVMEHLTNPLKALEQMHKLLKRDGILYVNTIDLKGMVLRKGVDHYFKFVHTFYYTNITLSSLIQQAGFEIVETWQMPPILKHSTFLHPNNTYIGELNIIARKKDLTGNPLPLKEDVDEIFRALEMAQKRDSRFRRYHAFQKIKLLGYPLKYIRKKLVRPKYVFNDYFDGTKILDDYQNI